MAKDVMAGTLQSASCRAFASALARASYSAPCQLGMLIRRLVALTLLLVCGQVLAQSSACNANEDVVTFNFNTAIQTNATGGTGTWITSSLGPASFRVGTTTGGAIRSNTITFTIDADTGAAWTNAGSGGNAPKQFTAGNLANGLLLSMNTNAASIGTGITLTFNRPMDKVRFFMGDVDESNTSPWQDRLEVAGYLNGNATTRPRLVASDPGEYVTATSADFSQITRNLDSGGCDVDDATCNVRIDFIDPVDTIRIKFRAGPGYANPGQQYVSFDDFSYCVPRRDLSLTKVDSTPTFTAGLTATYTLTVTNDGGTQTTGNYTVTDVLSTQGVSFVNPQAPGGGWTCTVGTTTLAADTVNCVRSTALGANGATTLLTLTVSLNANITATTIVNRAKVYGGGDPNKTALTSTGALANCSAASEGYQGGGATYLSGGSTNAGCAYEETAVRGNANLRITKTNNLANLSAGQTTSYTVTIANLGPVAAPGAVFLDPPTSGLSCTTVTFASTPAGSITTSPSPLTLNALQSTGIMLTPTFPANSTATFVVRCGVTASGQP